MPLILKVPGATAEEIARGLAAADAVLQTSGVTFAQALRAQFDREGWDIVHNFADDKQPPALVMAAANALDEARWAAMEACCAGWPEKPVDWQLEYANDGGGQDNGG